MINKLANTKLYIREAGKQTDLIVLIFLHTELLKVEESELQGLWKYNEKLLLKSNLKGFKETHVHTQDLNL